MNNKIVSPWVEGEKIPPNRVRDIYRNPPGISLPFYKSSVLIGSRGVGKTTLFRYQKELHDLDGVAIHLALPTELASITLEIGMGPLAFDVPPSIEPQVIGKATSLLAISISERLIGRDIPLTAAALKPCLPDSAIIPANINDIQDFVKFKRSVAKLPIDEFSGISETEPLPAYISELGKTCQSERGPLLLMFDRADMVVSSSIIPVLQLLDQSEQFIAQIAMRPGPVGQALTRVHGVPGDHYSIVHMGTLPSSVSWRAFLSGAVEAQVGDAYLTVPETLRDGILAISRDSIRTALEVFARLLSISSKSDVAEKLAAVETALEDIKENHLAAAQRILQKYNPNFRNLINLLRREATDEGRPPNGAIILSIQRSPAETLFDRSTKLERFIDEGLRCGAFCMPEGSRWTPGVHPLEVEIPHLLIWQPGDPLFSDVPLATTRIEKKERDVNAIYSSATKDPTIFVAFRMNVPESIEFRKQFVEVAAKHNELSKFVIVDGRVPSGTHWAPEIRKRIRDSKVVVGDVTAMSPEVMFEIGFAYGLKKTFIPVISGATAVSKLPNWLCATQLGDYGTPSGMTAILSDITAYLAEPDYVKRIRPATPIPSLAVWLRRLPWNEHAYEQYSRAASTFGLKQETFVDSNLDEKALRRASGASLLVVSLDGTEPDGLMHFVCGSVVSKPKAGAGSSLKRTVLVIEEPGVRSKPLIAESLRRCDDIVRVVSPERIMDEVNKFGDRHRRWLQTSADKKS